MTPAKCERLWRPRRRWIAGTSPDRVLRGTRPRRVRVVPRTRTGSPPARARRNRGEESYAARRRRRTGSRESLPVRLHAESGTQRNGVRGGVRAAVDLVGRPIAAGPPRVPRRPQGGPGAGGAGRRWPPPGYHDRRRCREGRRNVQRSRAPRSDRSRKFTGNEPLDSRWERAGRPNDTLTRAARLQVFGHLPSESLPDITLPANPQGTWAARHSLNWPEKAQLQTHPC